MSKTIYMISTMFYPSIGGVENHIYYISKYMFKQGYEVKIIMPVIGEDLSVSQLDGIEVHCVGVGTKADKEKYDLYKGNSKGNKLGFMYGYLRKNYFNKFSKDVYKYIEEDMKNNKGKEFIIHQHDFISSIKLSKELAKKYKVIFTNHTGEFLFLKKLPCANTIIKMLTKHFSYIIAPSNELAEFNNIRSEKTFEYIPNGVDMELFGERSLKEVNIIRNRYGLDTDKIIVLCPRRWAPTKGIIYLVKAVGILKKRGISDKFQFVFVGNEYSDYKEYVEEINKVISKDDISADIKLLGNINSEVMAEVMACTEIVVLPSLMEAVSLSALEAMASAKIILSTNVGGFPQIITQNENGIMVDSENEEAIANELQRISKNICEFKQMGEKAYKFVKDKYSWDDIGKRTEGVYKQFFNKTGEN